MFLGVKIQDYCVEALEGVELLSNNNHRLLVSEWGIQATSASCNYDVMPRLFRHYDIIIYKAIVYTAILLVR